jgi:hypothetical protein
MQREMTFAIARAFGATARAEEQQRNTNLGRSHTMDALNRYGPLVGRILLGLIFVVAGFGKLTGYAALWATWQAMASPWFSSCYRSLSWWNWVAA